MHLGTILTDDPEGRDVVVRAYPAIRPGRPRGGVNVEPFARSDER